MYEREQGEASERISKLREILTRYLRNGPSTLQLHTIQQLAKGAKQLDTDPTLKLRIKQTKSDIGQALRLLRANFELSSAMVEFGFADHHFMRVLLQSVALSILDLRDRSLPSEVKSHWIVRLINNASHMTSIFRFEIQEIHKVAIQCLGAVMKARQDVQVQLFLQNLKQRFERGQPQPGDLVRIYELEFINIFRILSFNVDPLLKEAEAAKLIRTIVKAVDRNEEARIPETIEQVLDTSALQIPLDMLLLRLIFSEHSDASVIKGSSLQDQALRLIIQNFRQREDLAKELIQVELLITPREVEEYDELRTGLAKIVNLSDRLIEEDFQFRTYKNFDRERYQGLIADIIKTLSALNSLLSFSRPPFVRKKTQSVARNLHIHAHLLSLMRSLSFRPTDHSKLFQQIGQFFHRLCIDQPRVQTALVPYLQYFMYLTYKKDVPLSPLIASVITASAGYQIYAQKVVIFTFKMLHSQDQFNPALLELLITLLSAARPDCSFSEKSPQNEDDDDEEERDIQDKQKFLMSGQISTLTFIQQTILKQLIKYPDTHLLLLESRQLKQKLLDHVASYKRDDNPRSFRIIQYHMNFIELLAHSSHQYSFGVLMARRLISSFESLVSSITWPHMPFSLKANYLELLYELYLSDFDPTLSVLNLNYLSDILQDVIIHDLSIYPAFLEGLALLTSPGDGSPEEEDYFAVKGGISLEEEKESVAQALKKEGQRAAAQPNLARLSTKRRIAKTGLTSQLGVQGSTNLSGYDRSLLNTHRPDEYWLYLSRPGRKLGSSRGILTWIVKLFQVIKRQRLKLSGEFVKECCQSLREVLLCLNDDLYKVLGRFEKEIGEATQDMILSVQSAINILPRFQKVELEKEYLLEEAGLLEIETAFQQKPGLQIYDSALDDEPSLARDGPDERMVQDNFQQVLGIVRDFIKNKRLTINEAFGIDGHNRELELDTFSFKKRLKQICRTKASYAQIEDLVKVINQHSDFPKNRPHAVNYNEFKLVLKKVLKSDGYREHKRDFILGAGPGAPQLDQSIQKEEAANKSQQMQGLKSLNVTGQTGVESKERSAAVEQDLNKELVSTQALTIEHSLTLYIQFYLQVLENPTVETELEQLADKLKSNIQILLSQRLNEEAAFLLQNILVQLERQQFTHSLLIVLNTLLQRTFITRARNLFEAQNYPHLTTQGSLLKLRKMQKLLASLGLLELLVKMIATSSQERAISLSITVLNSLLKFSNERVQKNLIDLMRESNYTLRFMKTLKSILSSTWNQLQCGTNNRVARQVFLQSQVGAREDLRLYLRARKQISLNSTVKNTLNLIQLMCDNCFSDFQNFLRSQGQGLLTSLNSVNMLYATGRLLIAVAQNEIDSMTPERTEFIVPQILRTCIDFCYGPCSENQMLFVSWKRLLFVLNLILQQTFQKLEEHSIYFIESFACACEFLLAITVQRGNRSGLKKVAEHLQRGIDFKNLREVMIQLYFRFIHSKIEAYLGARMAQSRTENPNSSKKRKLLRCGHKTEPKIMLNEAEMQIIVAGFDIFKLLTFLRPFMTRREEFRDFNIDVKLDFKYLLRRKVHRINTKRSELAEMQDFKDREKVNLGMAAFLDVRGEADDLNQREEELNYVAQQERVGAAPQGGEGVEESIIFKSIKKSKTSRENALLRSLITSKPECIQLERKTVESRSSKKTTQTKFKARTGSTFMKRIDSDFEGVGSSQFQQSVKQSKFMEEQELDDMEVRNLEQEEEDNDLVSFKNRSGLKVFKFNCCKRCCIDFLKCLTCKKKNKQKQGGGGPGSQSQDMTGSEIQLASFRINSFGGPRAGDSMVIRETRKELDMRRLTRRFKLQESLEREVFLTAFIFFSTNVASIEINFKESLERVTFKIPSYCGFLTNSTRKQFVLKSGTMNQQEKLQYLTNSLSLLKTEMLHQQHLFRKGKHMKWFANNWYLWAYLNFVLILAINLILLIQLRNTSDSTQLWGGNGALIMFWIFKIVQLLLAGLVFSSYLVETYPVLLQRYAGSSKFQQEFSSKFIPESKGSYAYAFVENADYTQSQERKCQILHTFRDVTNRWNLVLLLFSILGAFWLPICFYPLLLFDLTQRLTTLQNVIKAVYLNIRSILQTLALLVILIYLYSALAFTQFSKQYIGDGTTDFNNYCSTLYECLLSTLNNGIRAGGGIGETLAQPLNTDRNQFWGRYFFDLSFFMVIIIVMLNIIFGIIIDAFAALRDQRKEAQDAIENNCFICGIQSYEFEAKGDGWKAHTTLDHNLWAYIYFLMYLKEKPRSECTGVQKYVKDQLQENETDYFPVDMSLTIRRYKEEDQNTMEYKINKIVEGVEALQAK